MHGLSVKKVSAGTLIAGLLLGLIIWLWQLQPKAPGQAVLSQRDTFSNDTADPKETRLEPEENTVIKNTKVKLKGPTGNYQYLAVFSDEFNKILKTKPGESFETEISLTKGLNIIKLAGFGGQFKAAEEKTINYYMDGSSGVKYAYAGTVKSLFDTLITLSTESGEKSVRTGKTTDFVVPKDDDDKEASAGSLIKQVRIGDYAIALGNTVEKNKDTIFAQKLQIIRQDKPQITKKLTIAKVLTTPKNNSFSAQNLDDSKIVVFDFSKNTDVELDGKTVKASEITKDKTAFIFYTQGEDENSIDLIYLLP